MKYQFNTKGVLVLIGAACVLGGVIQSIASDVKAERESKLKRKQDYDKLRDFIKGTGAAHLAYQTIMNKARTGEYDQVDPVELEKRIMEDYAFYTIAHREEIEDPTLRD